MKGVIVEELTDDGWRPFSPDSFALSTPGEYTLTLRVRIVGQTAKRYVVVRDEWIDGVRRWKIASGWSKDKNRARVFHTRLSARREANKYVFSKVQVLR